MRPDSSIARRTGYSPANPPGHPSTTTASRVSTPCRCRSTPASECNRSGGLAPAPTRVDRSQPRSIAAQVQRHATIVRPERTASYPHDVAHRNELVQQARVVVGDSARDHIALDDACRQCKALELEHDLEQPVAAGRARADSV